VLLERLRERKRKEGTKGYRPEGEQDKSKKEEKENVGKAVSQKKLKRCETSKEHNKKIVKGYNPKGVVLKSTPQR